MRRPSPEVSWKMAAFRLARAWSFGAAALALVLPLSSPASAAGTTSVTVGPVTRSGSVLSVSGSSTYADQPFVVQATDPVGDTLMLPGALGQDLTGLAISTNTNGTINFRFLADQLPPVLNGMPSTVYGWTFCIGPPPGEEEEVDPPSCWEITASRMNWLIPNPEPWLQVWRCPATCSPNELTSITGPLVFDGATKTITATLPLGSLGGQAGFEITPLIGFSFHNGPAWTAMAGWYLVEEDFADYADAYAIPGKQVSLAVGASGQDPATVSYPTEANVSSNGSFTGSVDVSTLSPGEHTLYARACFGSNNCAYATRPVTI